MSIDLLGKLANNRRLRAAVPGPLRSILRGLLPAVDYQRSLCRASAEALYGGPIPDESTYPPRWNIMVGILKDHMSYYVYNVRACEELGVPFRVVDVLGDNWLDCIHSSGCKTFLVWPSINHATWKPLYDERLAMLAEANGYEFIPRLKELWLQDSKRRVAYWLSAHGVPAPRTWIFYDRKAALQFIRRCELPVVFKTDVGASSRGVSIVSSRVAGQALVRRAFGHGIRLKHSASNDRQVGHVLFQEFIPHDFEWRVVRVGPHYLCRRKTRVGHYASGSGTIGWARPPEPLLDFVKEVTDLGHFENMAIDVFESPPFDARGPYLVNELQCLFGAIVKENNVNTFTGRWNWDLNRGWSFEHGYFYQNACANLRVELYLRRQDEASPYR